MRPEIDRELSMLYRHWKVEEAPHGLAEHIVAQATKLPQPTPWHRRVQSLTRTLFAHPSRTLVPGAAFAALLLIGLYAGQVQTSDEDFGIDTLLVSDMMEPGEFDL